MRALHISLRLCDGITHPTQHPHPNPNQTSQPHSTYPPQPHPNLQKYYAFVPVSSFGLSIPFRTFHDALLAATCDGSMLMSQTTMYAMLQAEGIAITSAFLLLFLVYVVALLQSRLIKAAGHWQQHRASLNQPRNHTFSSRTNTTAAELYYLRHMRSCAAAATGNKGGNPSPRTALQISAASFIGRLLQSIMRHCYFTVFLLLHSLLQSIGQMVRYYAKIAMKPIIVSFAILWLSLRPPSPPQNKKEKQTP